MSAGASASHDLRFEKPRVKAGAGGGDSPYAPAGAAAPEAATEPGKPLEIAHDADGNPYVAGELLVSYAPSASTADKRHVRRAVEGGVEDRFGEIDAELIEVPEIEDRGPGALEGAIEELESDPNVESADPNYVHETRATVNDEFFEFQWGLRRIGAPSAWDRTVGGDTVINVLDSGIEVDNLTDCDPNSNLAHPDIGGVINQFDFYNNDPCAEDRNQHGTHVAGIAAALTDNVEGIAGTSPGGLLLIGKVCEDTDTTLGGPAQCPIDAQIAALLAAGDLPTSGPTPRPDVINMSLGGAGTTPQHHDAVGFATGRGIALVVSAGNENSSALKFPASYPESIAVASTNISNGKSDFSNFGPWVDIAAPGGDFNNPANEDILSTIPFGDYEFLNGTSMSAPHVTGVASLLAAQGHGAARIRQLIESRARDLGAPGRDDIFGHGLVDAAEATLPASQTRACRAARAEANAARAARDAAAAAVGDAARKVDQAKKAKKKAKKKVKKADGKSQRKKAKKKLRGKKHKMRRAKRRLADANAVLGQANNALAQENQQQSAACSG